MNFKTEIPKNIQCSLFKFFCSEKLYLHYCATHINWTDIIVFFKCVLVFSKVGLPEVNIKTQWKWKKKYLLLYFICNQYKSNE